MNKDWQLILKSAITIVVTTVWMTALVSSLPTAPATRYTLVTVGNVLLLIILAVELIATDLARYGSREALQLSPPTLLALWIVGMLAILLATDGLQWLKPDVTFWVFLPIALTVGSWPGLAWLWERFAGKRTGKGLGPPSGPTRPSISAENSVYGLWLLLAAMALIALQSFVVSRNGAEQLIEMAFSLATCYLAVTQMTDAKSRAVLLVAGTALAVPPLITWLQQALGATLSPDVWRYLLWLRSVIVGGAAVYLGFAASPNLVPRLLITILGITWIVFATVGAPSATDPTIVLQLLLVPFVIWCYWANAQFEKGKHKENRA